MTQPPRMRVHHFVLDPFSRRLRLALAEHGIDFELLAHLPWKPDEELRALSPHGDLPVLEDTDGCVAVGILAAGEYVEERHAGPDSSLLGATPAERAETRRLLAHFDGRFHARITAVVLAEKVLRRFLPATAGGGAPDTTRLRAAATELRAQLRIIAQLTEERGLLAGPRLSLADLAAAAHV